MTKHIDAIAANTRAWNSYWYWRDKQIRERGAARSILQSAGMPIEKLISRPEGNDPPDCEALVDGLWSGIEVTELIDRKTLERALRAVKARAAGEEPTRPETWHIWQQDSFIATLQDQIARKDKAKPKGGPYERYILVVHTDETFLDAQSVAWYLTQATFRASMITDVILGLSYHPSCGHCPTFALKLA